MKLRLILALSTLMLAFSSCQKCQTCVPYRYANGVISTSADTKFSQAIKLCDKADIKSYQSITTFTDAQGDTVRFICQ